MKFDPSRSPSPELIRRTAPIRTVPAYVQIEEQLAERIAVGEFSAGDRLPTERELSTQLSVSRLTIRAAMDRLAQRGVIVRRQGSGTYVAEPKLRQDASHLRGFFEDSVDQGVFPVSQLIESVEILATKHLAGMLEIRVGESIYRVVRARGPRSGPVVLETSYFPVSVVPGLLTMDLEHSSIYRLMDREFQARPIRARQSIEVILAQAAEATLLGVPKSSPVLLVERVAWDAQGRTVEYARDLYRADRSRFVTELNL